MYPSFRSLFLLGLPLIAAAQSAGETAVSKRADGDSPSGLLGGEVSWTSWTSGDGQQTGKDDDGVPYIQSLIQMMLDARPGPSERTLVFWAGGETDRDDVNEYAEMKLDPEGHQFEDFFGQNLMDQLGIEHGSNLYWRALNRMSKGTSSPFSATTYAD